MRKLIWLAAMCLVTSALHAQQPCVPDASGMQCTPNLNLWLPPANYQTWNIPLNNNSNILDTVSTKWLRNDQQNTFSYPITAPQFNGSLNGNASTATRLTATPTACPSSPAQQVATGIQANGNAVCITPPSVVGTAGNNQLLLNSNGSVAGTPGLTYTQIPTTGTPTGYFLDGDFAGDATPVIFRASNLVGVNGISAGLGAPFLIAAPYNPANALAKNTLACMISGTAQPCPVNATNFDGITAATGPDQNNNQVAILAVEGEQPCVFDGVGTAPTVGDWATLSATTAGDCHDYTTLWPPIGVVVGSIVALASGSTPPIVKISRIQPGGNGFFYVSRLTAIPWNTFMPQGAYTTWDMTAGSTNSGETDFINSSGTGTGAAFYWYDGTSLQWGTNPTSVHPIMSLDSAGNLKIAGTLTQNTSPGTAITPSPTGLTATMTVKGRLGSNCDLIFVAGLLTRTTCP